MVIVADPLFDGTHFASTLLVVTVCPVSLIVSNTVEHIPSFEVTFTTYVPALNPVAEAVVLIFGDHV